MASRWGGPRQLRRRHGDYVQDAAFIFVALVIILALTAVSR